MRWRHLSFDIFIAQGRWQSLPLHSAPYLHHNVYARAGLLSVSRTSVIHLHGTHSDPHTECCQSRCYGPHRMYGTDGPPLVFSNGVTRDGRVIGVSDPFGVLINTDRFLRGGDSRSVACFGSLSRPDLTILLMKGRLRSLRLSSDHGGVA